MTSVATQSNAPSTQPDRRPLLNSNIAMLLACLFWGISFVAAKEAVSATPPLTVVALRLWISALCFGLWFRFKGETLSKLSNRHKGQLWLLSFFGITLHYGSQTIGLQFTSAANASLLSATAPLAIMLVGAITLRERLSGKQWVALVLSLLGVLVAMGWKNLAAIEVGKHLLGDSLVFFSILMWGVFTVFGKRLTGEFRPIELTAHLTIFGAITMLPLAAYELSQSTFQLSDVTLKSWAAIAFLGITCSFLAVLFYFSALQRSSSQKIALYLYLVPPFTYLVAGLYLGEPIGLNLLLGTLLVLAGVKLAK